MHKFGTKWLIQVLNGFENDYFQTDTKDLFLIKQ